MNNSIIVVICCLAVASAANYYAESRALETTQTPIDTERTEVPPSSPATDDLAVKVYSFFCEVKHEESKNDYSHAESSDGKVVQGKYYVQLPDGRRQTVEYVADSNGYVPQVKYEGEAKYPEFQPARTSRIASY
ncbi:cuticle protein 7-like [Daphnia carinata]|uniref:cuticle protein 7-like n=1 Tax=Daphnia carinata TaxID=120202 RepID=UPI00257FE788|nr:cuticle protein 7-like [Daphnia carinata]